MVASIESLTLKYYQFDKDEFVFPGGMRVSGMTVRKLQQEERDRKDAAKAYDPYSHWGSKV